MGWFSDDHEESSGQFHAHEASLTHELLAGAVAFEAAKAYEKHCEENGEPVEHGTAKALLAGFAGAATDRLIETKGLDYLDRERAKRDAEERLSATLASRY